MKKILPVLFILTLGVSGQLQAAEPAARLYLVPYSHLDTQWVWSYETTINENLTRTLDDNFRLFEKYPEYQFNFTGAFRYKLMKQYWPARYQKLKEYIAQGRWHVAGSAWDEMDVIIPDPESITRHILYANRFFQEEFGKVSQDFMLPDSFGYPASLPTLIHHSGLKGFSTQKLTWGAARGVPFNIGLWVGADGSEVLSALNPGAYESHVPDKLFEQAEWKDRLLASIPVEGRPSDYRYFGIGDSGGAPREEDVQHAIAAMKSPTPGFEVVLGASDQFFRDTPASALKAFPRVEGEMLLREHSAGILSSNSALKIANRQSEHKARQAEYLAAKASLIDGGAYPRATLRRAWETFLPAQMHDIMGGTSIPEANSHSMNDHYIAQKTFQSVIEGGAARIISALDTTGDGYTVALFNTLAAPRQDNVVIVVPGAPGYTHARGPKGDLVSLQILSKDEESTRYLFPVSMEGTESSIYKLVTAPSDTVQASPILVSRHQLESDLLRVTLGKTGDIVSIFNKTLGREELKAPIRYQFLNEFPLKYASWNMTWKDRQRPPKMYLDTPATIEIVENGVWRSALRVTRKVLGSEFVQIIRLTKGRPVVDIEERIDWKSQYVSFKVAVRPKFEFKETSYDMGLSVARRPKNNKDLFEMPQHQWMSASPKDNSRGLTLINSCCYGSDQPSEDTMRLTLLYTPHSMEKDYRYGETQDWGHHVLNWGIYPHAGEWRDAGSDAVADRKNDEILAFHPSEDRAGRMGKSFALLKVEGAKLRVIKQTEDETPGNPHLLLRLYEKAGGIAKKFKISLPTPALQVTRLNGQEQKLDKIAFEKGAVTGDIAGFGIQTLSVSALAIDPSPLLTSTPLSLPFNTKAFSDRNRAAQVTVKNRRVSFPSEEYMPLIKDRGVDFSLPRIHGIEDDVVEARGQILKLPPNKGAIHILAFATSDHKVELKVDGRPYSIPVAGFHGAIGDADRRRLDKDFKWLSQSPAFLKDVPLAAFASYSHGVKGNLVYYPNYLFHYTLPAGSTLELPNDDDFYIAAITLSRALTVIPLQDRKEASR